VHFFSSRRRFAIEQLECATVSFADVVRFTGRSRIEVLDLVRAGVLEEVSGRGTCQLTAGEPAYLDDKQRLTYGRRARW
jgi:hypothetical protein